MTTTTSERAPVRPWGFLTIEWEAEEWRADLSGEGGAIMLSAAQVRAITWAVPEWLDLENAERPVLTVTTADGATLWVEGRWLRHIAPDALSVSWPSWEPFGVADGKPDGCLDPRPVTQTHTGAPRGNCGAAALASLIGCELAEIPDLFEALGVAGSLCPWGAARGDLVWRDWLLARGLAMIARPIDPTPMAALGEILEGVLWIAAGRNPDGIGHVVLALGRAVLWDSNPQRRGILPDVDAVRLIIPRGGAGASDRFKQVCILAAHEAGATIDRCDAGVLDRGNLGRLEAEIPPEALAPAIPFMSTDPGDDRPLFWLDWPPPHLTLTPGIYALISEHLDLWRERGMPHPEPGALMIRGAWDSWKGGGDGGGA